MFGCPWVRISRESGSVTLILPSGTSGGVYGFGGLAEPPAVAATVRSRGSAHRPGSRRARPRAPHPSGACASTSRSLTRARDRPRVLARVAPRALAVLGAATRRPSLAAGPRTDPDQAPARPWRSPPHPPPAQRALTLEPLPARPSAPPAGPPGSAAARAAHPRAPRRSARPPHDRPARPPARISVTIDS